MWGWQGGDEQFDGVVGVFWVREAVGGGVVPGAEDGGVKGQGEVRYRLGGVVEGEDWDRAWWWHYVVSWVFGKENYLFCW